jgi:uncharacterized protein (TIGR03083 family)
MIPPGPHTALAAETTRLSQALHTVTAWDTPTRCTPWDAAGLTAHITMTINRLDRMLDGPEPPEATVTAADYYTPDQRFSPDGNRERIDTATQAAQKGGPALAADFDATCHRILTRCATQPPGRRVYTRYDDPMTLDDFLTTRVVETAVHGIDLADALGQPRWTTPEARHHLTALLLGPCHEAALADLGMDAVDFIAKATGRDPFGPNEKARAESLGLTWLTLG